MVQGATRRLLICELASPLLHPNLSRAACDSPPPHVLSHLLSPSAGMPAEPFGSPCLMGRSASWSSWSDAPDVPSLAEPRLRERSLTPEDAEMAECSPITPSAAPSHAATSPLLAAAAAAPEPAEAAAVPPAAAEAAAQRAASAAALWRRIQSFMHCVSGSPLIQSALLSLQLSGAFPAAAEAGLAAEQGLEWTLSQMLSFHLKSGWAEGESSRMASHAAAAVGALGGRSRWADVWYPRKRSAPPVRHHPLDPLKAWSSLTA